MGSEIHRHSGEGEPVEGMRSARSYPNFKHGEDNSNGKNGLGNVFDAEHCDRCASTAQTAPKDQSNIEKFSAKSGTLIEKQFVDIGSLKQVKVQLLIITDMIVGSKVSGVRLEYVASSRYSSDTKVTFLRSEE